MRSCATAGINNDVVIVGLVRFDLSSKLHGIGKKGTRLDRFYFQLAPFSQRFEGRTLDVCIYQENLFTDSRQVQRQLDGGRGFPCSAFCICHNDVHI